MIILTGFFDLQFLQQGSLAEMRLEEKIYSIFNIYHTLLGPASRMMCSHVCSPKLFLSSE